MKGLRDNPPQAFGSFPVLAVRDYQTGLRLEDGQASHLGLPVSNVLYYELDRGAWLCAVSYTHLSQDGLMGPWPGIGPVQGVGQGLV